MNTSRRLLFVPILILSLHARSIHARIAETMDQCIERYGAPREQKSLLIDGRSAPWIRFEKGVLTVEITFIAGIAERIVYRSDYSLNPETESGIDLSRGVAFLLLDRNSCHSSDWHQVLSNADTGHHNGTTAASFFQRDNKGRSRIAYYNYEASSYPKGSTSSGQLDIRTSRYIELIKRLPNGI